MRIMLVTMDYPPPMGGIQVVTKNLEEDLRVAGHEVCLVNFDGRNINNYKSLRPVDFLHSQATRNTNYTWRSLLNPWWLFKPSGYREFVYDNVIYRETNRVRRSFRPDITHIMKPTLYSAIYGCKEPFVVSCHGEEIQDAFPVTYSLHHASAIHCVSQYSRELVKKLGENSDGKIKVIYNSIDVDLYRNTGRTRECSIATCCRLIKRKNVDTIIRALSLLPSEIQKTYRYIIIGDGPERRSLFKLASKIGLQNVSFVGFVSEKAKVGYLSRSRLFVLCPKPFTSAFESNEEGLGISFIEAQAAGTPTLGSNIGGIPEAIGDGGLLVQNAEDPKEIATSIQRLIEDHDLYECLRARGLTRVQQFDRKLIFKQFESLYRDVLVHAGRKRQE